MASSLFRYRNLSLSTYRQVTLALFNSKKSHLIQCVNRLKKPQITEHTQWKGYYKEITGGGRSPTMDLSSCRRRFLTNHTEPLIWNGQCLFNVLNRLVFAPQKRCRTIGSPATHGLWYSYRWFYCSLSRRGISPPRDNIMASCSRASRSNPLLFISCL